VTHSRLAVAALLAVAAAWGSTLQRIDVADYLALRFAIAAIVLLAVHPAAVGRLRRLDRRRGVALGVTYGVAQLPQTEGLRHTSASDRALGLDRGGPGQPVFASAFAVTLGGESLTVRMLVGGACVVGAMYLVELAPRRKIEAEVQHLAR
jgi:drug/metabolite transporter (DMT)-like permease